MVANAGYNSEENLTRLDEHNIDPLIKDNRLSKDHKKET